MSLIWAAIIGGVICATAQILAELKVPFPVIAIIYTSLGGLLTLLGVVPALQALGSAGISVTAMGCGNGAYNSAIEMMSGNVVAILLVLALNVALVLGGALCGCALAKRKE